MKSIVLSITREDLFGNEKEQKDAAKTITAFLEALPRSSAWGYADKRVVIGVKDFADNLHLGWVINNNYRTFKDRIKHLYILSYELKIRETLEGKNVRTLIYQEETDDGERQFLYQRRICYFRRNFKEDPKMFDEDAIGHKTWPEYGKAMFEKFVEQSEIPPVFDHMAKQLFNDLLSGDIKELEDLSNLPSKEEGERMLAEAEKKRIEEARKRDLEELNEELKGLPKYIKELEPEQLKKALNVVACRYHSYYFEDAAVVNISEKEIKMNLTGKMQFIWEPGVVKLCYKDYELEIGISRSSSLLSLSRAETTNLRDLFDEIHNIFEHKFPDVLDRDIFFKKVLRDFHKYFHGMSAW